jgi:putative ubiquitin-RnfH superfamily antitoxin RatB of RatAB toxin-antitoxin module
MAKNIVVEVVYALPKEQTLLSFNATEGINVQEAILQSGMLAHYTALDIETITVGIFGKRTTLKKVLRDKDRVEIYRPLIADPKEVRKRRATEGKKTGKGGGKMGKATSKK